MLNYTNHQYKGFIADLKNQASIARPLPLKVFGPSSAAAATMLATYYADTPEMPGPTNFGTLQKSGAELDAVCTYSSIVNGEHYQGDVIPFPSRFRSHYGSASYAMILSHSCDAKASNGRPTLLIAPVFFDNVDLEPAFEWLSGINGLDSSGKQRKMVPWFANQKGQYVTFPAHPFQTSISAPDERFVLPLHRILSIDNQNISAPVLRLTYRALAFLQLRLAAYFCRDVDDSDDERDF